MTGLERAQRRRWRRAAGIRVFALSLDEVAVEEFWRAAGAFDYAEEPDHDALCDLLEQLFNEIVTRDAAPVMDWLRSTSVGEFPHSIGRP